MIDGMGNLQSIAVLGGTDPVALAVVDHLVGPRLARVAIAGPPTARLADAGVRIEALGVRHVATHAYDPLRPGGNHPHIDEIFDAGDIDLTVVTGSVTHLIEALGPEPTDDQLADLVTANLTSPMVSSLQVVDRLRRQGHGLLVVISRTTGSTSNRLNLVNSGIQTGIDTFGMRTVEALHGTGARGVVARLDDPAGHGSDLAVDDEVTRMFYAEAASQIAKAIRSKRQRIVYYPASAKSAFAGVGRLPSRFARR
ncbi:MAG: hypothetical protein ACOYD0_10995 [Candidatus Nanopelagicales bacterium]